VTGSAAGGIRTAFPTTKPRMKRTTRGRGAAAGSVDDAARPQTPLTPRFATRSFADGERRIMVPCGHRLFPQPTYKGAVPPRGYRTSGT
jgi:hypothetical protein